MKCSRLEGFRASVRTWKEPLHFVDTAGELIASEIPCGAGLSPSTLDPFNPLSSETETLVSNPKP